MSFASARPVLEALQASLPPGLKAAGPLNSTNWDRWVRARDREIGGRVDDGVELTVANLLRLGVAYTKESRIEYPLLKRYGQDGAVNSMAQRRAADLVAALAAPRPNAVMVYIRSFLEDRGFHFARPEDRQKVTAYLLATLARQRDEVARESEQAKQGHAQLFKDRGLSTDSDIYADFALEMHFRNLMRQRLLKPGSVRRVAIVGPGLDVVNKKYGYDFYPPQVTQPFAVIDSLLRLGLATPDSIRVTTFDVSPRVNQHLERARAQAKSGHPYAVQLLWLASLGGSDTFLSNFKGYWSTLGERIGKTATPIAVPGAARFDVTCRSVSIRPEVVSRVSPVSMNVVLQTLRLPPDERFDLVIGTNIFLYYNELEQALARANLGGMIRPGGFLISNTELPGLAPSTLIDSLRTDVAIRPGSVDQVFSYVRLN